MFSDLIAERELERKQARAVVDLLEHKEKIMRDKLEHLKFSMEGFKSKGAKAVSVEFVLGEINESLERL